MRRRRKHLEVSTFPFLAVLLCAMGALILVLMAMDRKARQAAEARGKDEAAAAEAEYNRQVARRLREHEGKKRAQRQAWEKKRDALRTRVRAEEEALDRELHRVQAHLLEVARKLRAEQADLEQLRGVADKEKRRLAGQEQAVATARRESAQSSAKLTATDRARARLASELVDLEKSLKELAEARRRDASTWSVVPYRGKRGESRRPVYVECTAKGIIFHPDEQPLPPHGDLRGALRKRLARQQQRLEAMGVTDRRAYVMLLVRPDGMGRYYEIQAAARELGVDFGYEFVDADWVLRFPEDDSEAPLPLTARAPSAANAPPRRGQPGKGPGIPLASGFSSESVPGRGAGHGNGPGRGAGANPGGVAIGAGRSGPGAPGGVPGVPGQSRQGLAGRAGGAGPGGMPGTGASVVLNPPLPFGSEEPAGNEPPAGTAKASADGWQGPGSRGPGGTAAMPSPLSPGVSSPALSPRSPGQPSSPGRPDALGLAGLGNPASPGTASGPAPSNSQGGGPVLGPRSSGPPAAAAGSGANQGEPGIQTVRGPVPPGAAPAQDIPTPNLLPAGTTSGPVVAQSGNGQGGSSEGTGEGGSPAGQAPAIKGLAANQGKPDGAAQQRGREEPLALAPPPTPARRRQPVVLRPAQLGGDEEALIFVECQAQVVIVHPGRRRVPIDALNHSPAYNQLRQAVQKQIQRRQALSGRGEAARVHLRFLIHRDGERTFHLAYPALEGLLVPKTRYSLQPEDDVSRIVSEY
jgi:hypothetical protein